MHFYNKKKIVNGEADNLFGFFSNNCIQQMLITRDAVENKIAHLLGNHKIGYKVNSENSD